MRTLVNACCAATALFSTHVLAAEPEPAAPAWTVSGTLTAASDYRFRGLTQTQGRPVLQGSFDASHASGWYVGLFGSGVSHAAYNNGGGTEFDVYGGYRHTWAEGRSVDAGIVTYWYPGAHYQLPGERIDYNTQEAKLAVNVGTVNVTGWVGLSEHWFGFASDPFTGRQVARRGTAYVEANWSPEIGPGLTLNLHAGHQRLRHLPDYDFTDVKVGVTKTWKAWSVSLAAMYNNGDRDKAGVPLWTFFDADGHGKHVAGSSLVLTASQTF